MSKRVVIRRDNQEELIDKALKLITEEGKSVNMAAMAVGVPPSTMAGWLKEHKLNEDIKRFKEIESKNKINESLSATVMPIVQEVKKYEQPVATVHGFIEKNLTSEQYIGYLLGCIYGNLSNYPNNGLTALKSISNYLNKLINVHIATKGEGK